MSPQAALPAERVSEELARVLARAEFHEQESLLQQFLRWLGGHFGGERANELASVLITALLVFLLFLLLRALRNSARRRQGLELGSAAVGASMSPAQRLLELKAAADQARAAGDARLALRLLFEALLIALGGRGDFEFRPAWTNRELVRRGRHAPGALTLLDELVRELEPKEFGRARVEPGDLARLEKLLEPHLTRIPHGHGRWGAST
ncbi:MAG: hypothetical protein ABL998_24145 [Planctomycetota bacterium]